MFNWSKFLDIAMELSLKNEEEYLRSSLSNMGGNDIMDSKEFNELKDFYQLRNEFKVEKFIELNPNLKIILNELKAPLKLNFPNGEFILSINRDFETSEETLLVNINVDRYTYDNGIMDMIDDIDSAYIKLMQKLDVISKIFLNPMCS